MTGWLLYFARRYDRANELFQHTIDLEPNYFQAYWGNGWTLVQQGRFNEAIDNLKRGIALGGGTELYAALGHAYARAGRTEDARVVLGELYGLRRERYVSPFYFALAHVGLLEIEETFAALEQAYEDRFEWLVQCRTDPAWDPLRSDPRFIDLLRRLDLLRGGYS